jgi:branched-subunit amino acid ABC-type transport system permease component
VRLYIELFILGLPIAGIFALIATGVIMVYRASRILTLAQGGIAMFTAYTLFQLNDETRWDLPMGIALPGAIVVAAALGFIIERVFLRPLRDRPVLTSVIMTVGILALLTGLAGIIWSYDRQRAPQLTPEGAVTLFGITLPYKNLFILAAAAVILLGVVYLFKYTTLGISMRAVADDRRAALLMGIPADRVSSTTWIIGSVLAGLAGILLSPIVELHPLILTLLSIPAYGAALFGSLVSVPAMLLGALAIGTLYAEVPSLPAIKDSDFPGVRELAIFGSVLIFMFLRGQSTQLQEEEI